MKNSKTVLHPEIKTTRPIKIVDDYVGNPIIKIDWLVRVENTLKETFRKQILKYETCRYAISDRVIYEPETNTTVIRADSEEDALNKLANLNKYFKEYLTVMFYNCKHDLNKAIRKDTQK